MAGNMRKLSDPLSETSNLSSKKGTGSSYGIANEEEQQLEEQKIVASEGLNPAYDLESLITFKVFGVVNGTVFNSRILWVETGMSAALYWVVVAFMYYVRFDGFSTFVGKESTIRAFIAMFSTLIGLLLSFYTALNLGRWWSMRKGVQNIEEGAKELVMMVSQGCSDDPVLLATISRYAEASLFLIFAASQNKDLGTSPRLLALKEGLLTQEEADKLAKLNPHMTFVHAETLWVWLANAVTRLHDQGLTKGPPHYCSLLNAVEQGRMGVATIQTYLETPIPLGYVHLLCLMVKLHNFILTVLMALACVMLAGGEKGMQPVGMFRTSFRAFFMPFLYNSILILNHEVSDPFGDDAGDFRYSSMHMNIRMSSQSYSNANKILPAWITDHKYSKVNTETA
jgi:predicted membrane chloride channel (bestrophin family)